MNNEKPHSGFTKWFLKNIFGIDLEARSSEHRATLATIREQLENVIADRQNEIDRLKQKSETLHTQLDESNHQLEELQAELHKYKVDQTTLKSAKTHAENQLKKLKVESQKQVDDSKKIAQQLESTLKQKTKELADVNSTLDGLRAQIEQLEKQKKDLEDDFSRAQSVREQLTSDNKRLEQKIARTEKLKVTQKQVIDDLKRLVESTQKEKEHLQQLLDDCQKRIEQLQQEQTDSSSNKAEYEERIAKLDNQVKSLEKDLESRDRTIESLKAQIEESKKRVTELENQLSSIQTAGAPQDDEEDLSKEIKELAQLLADRDHTIQTLNEKLAEMSMSEQDYLGKLALLEQRLTGQIESLKNLLRDKDITIRQQADRIKELEAALSAHEQKEQEPPIKEKTPASSEEKPEEQFYPLAKDLSDEETYIPSDLPTIEDDGSIVTSRRIKTVIDARTGEHIDADEFFSRPKEEIAMMSRRLEIISKTDDDPLFICAKCLQPVKISKITTTKGESLFFSHCHRDVPCEWRAQNESSAKPVIILDDIEIKPFVAEKSRYEHLRDVIYNSLLSQQKKGYEINEVAIKKKIKGETSRIWRMFDVYVKWHNIDIVFKLQRSTDYLQYLVGLDEFCKQKKLFIIWVFGSDSATSYDYLLQNNYQNTLFDNGSCVFILDDETETACIKSGELRLKCNWLVDGKHWFYTRSKTNSNGVLVSLNDLNFDNTETYKPYYRKMASSPLLSSDEIIELKPGVYKYRQGALWGIYNKEKDIKSKCIYSDISLGDKGHIVAVLDDYIQQRVGLLSDEGEEIPTETKRLAPDVYRLNIFERFCLADKAGNPFTEMYESIEKWGNERLVIKTKSGFGVMDYKGKIIALPRYQEFVIDNSYTAKVTDYSGTYLINYLGDIIPDETVELTDGLRKVRHLNRWGVYDQQGILIIKYSYFEIATFRKRFYGINENGLFKLAKAPRYDYRLPFRATYRGKSPSGDYVFDCHGVKMLMPDNDYNRAERFVGFDYDVYLLNVQKEEDQEIYTIAAADDTTNEMKFDHIDMDSDFKKGERLTGRVTRIKAGKRVYIRFPDGRQSYISRSRIKRWGFNPQKYVPKSAITIEKIDFDPFYETTKWKVIK